MTVPNEDGRVRVTQHKGKKQSDMGEALTLDSIVNSIDAELLATGPSAKGPNRGAIVRHGKYVLWGFEGPVSAMTEAGKSLFVNAVHYAAKHTHSAVLEKRRNGTRDALFAKLEYARKVPGYLNTIKNTYVPKELKTKSLEQIERWVTQNRPYLRADGRRFEVDEFARRLGIPNHKKAFLEKCLLNLESGVDRAASVQALVRYTGRTDFADSVTLWKNWYMENKGYLYFSDCDGFLFKIDEEAKAKNQTVAALRRWSSETLDFRYRPN